LENRKQKADILTGVPPTSLDVQGTKKAEARPKVPRRWRESNGLPHVWTRKFSGGRLLRRTKSGKGNEGKKRIKKTEYWQKKSISKNFARDALCENQRTGFINEQRGGKEGTNGENPEEKVGDYVLYHYRERFSRSVFGKKVSPSA